MSERATATREEGIAHMLHDARMRDDDRGFLWMHRAIDGEHNVEDHGQCWCCPHKVPLDTMMTAGQIEAWIERQELPN